MKYRPQIIIRCRGVDQFEAVQRMASEAESSVNEWILRQLEAAHPSLVEPKKVSPKVKGAIVLALAIFFMAGSAWGQKALPKAKLYDSGSWGCPSPYWPFQSWTHKWSCVKGEFEAKSTWNLYKEEPFFIIEGLFEYRDAWFVHYEVDAYKCDKFKRDDGLVHSLIIGQEYTQTCDNGKQEAPPDWMKAELREAQGGNLAKTAERLWCPPCWSQIKSAIPAEKAS